jgi:hypothetical protein
MMVRLTSRSREGQKTCAACWSAERRGSAEWNEQLGDTVLLKVCAILLETALIN